MLAFQFERKVICEVPTLVITAQKPERIGVPDLQGPKVENALERVSRGKQKQAKTGGQRTSMLKYPLST